MLVPRIQHGDPCSHAQPHKQNFQVAPALWGPALCRGVTLRLCVSRFIVRAHRPIRMSQDIRRVTRCVCHHAEKKNVFSGDFLAFYKFPRKIRSPFIQCGRWEKCFFGAAWDFWLLYLEWPLEKTKKISSISSCNNTSPVLC